MRRLRVAGGDRGIVEEAEAHRRRGLGVVAGRPRRDEGVVDSPRADLVDRESRAARRAQRRLEVPGDIAVSESSWIAPWLGLARSIAST